MQRQTGEPTGAGGAERTTIVALGNAGFHVAGAGHRILLDPMFESFPGVPALDTPASSALDLILITHSHWDHFDAAGVGELARRTGAGIVGPRPVVRKLAERGGKANLMELEPAGRGAFAKAEARGIGVTAFRTVHGLAHNSYLVEWPGLRLLHDGDNEDTTCLNLRLLAGLDVLMLCPWQGSRWVEFIEAVRPRHWLLMHMSAEELDLHEQGRFLPDLCEHIPQVPVALRPGASLAVMAGGES